MSEPVVLALAVSNAALLLVLCLAYHAVLLFWVSRIHEAAMGLVSLRTLLVLYGLTLIYILPARRRLRNAMKTDKHSKSKYIPVYNEHGFCLFIERLIQTLLTLLCPSSSRCSIRPVLRTTATRPLPHPPPHEPRRTLAKPRPRLACSGGLSRTAASSKKQSQSSLDGAVRVNPEPVLDLSAFRIRACTAANWNREECATMSASFGTGVGDAGGRVGNNGLALVRATAGEAESDSESESAEAQYAASAARV
ncbi:hypothetical protein GGX14DRAFT_575259 [Mycena pura]|uniref:Uncharacterized protein n=1 Tax=Mycena pura TaxID=153505 RepID=A0AAD6Y894_9AGAR|nr:hypothetical protein GGX14DRAFT_575259 [Mycena pura]